MIVRSRSVWSSHTGEDADPQSRMCRSAAMSGGRSAGSGRSRSILTGRRSVTGALVENAQRAGPGFAALVEGEGTDGGEANLLVQGGELGAAGPVIEGDRGARRKLHGMIKQQAADSRARRAARADERVHIERATWDQSGRDVPRDGAVHDHRAHDSTIPDGHSDKSCLDRVRGARPEPVGLRERARAPLPRPAARNQPGDHFINQRKQRVDVPRLGPAQSESHLGSVAGTKGASQPARGSAQCGMCRRTRAPP